jgi:hypothetical protein
MFATLLQAISNSSATAAASVYKVRRNCPTIWSIHLMTTTLKRGG